MTIQYRADDRTLTADEFMDLFVTTWPQTFDMGRVAAALEATTNITARDYGRLIGCVRILSDGCFCAMVPEILVHPDYRDQRVARRLFELAYEHSPTSIMFGAQKLHDELTEAIGWTRGPAVFYRRK